MTTSVTTVTASVIPVATTPTSTASSPVTTTPLQRQFSVPQSPKSDYKSDDSASEKKYDAATKEELLQLAKKQEKALTRYKTKFSEVRLLSQVSLLNIDL